MSTDITAVSLTFTRDQYELLRRVIVMAKELAGEHLQGAKQPEDYLEHRLLKAIGLLEEMGVAISVFGELTD